MRLPTAADVELLAHPRWGDAALGALAAGGLFTAVATAVTTVATIVGYAAAGPEPAAYTRISSVIASFGVALLVSGIISGVISLTWGLLTAMLLGVALARVRVWPVHAAVYFLLGACTPLLATYLLFHGVDLRNPLLIAAMVTTGAAVLAGWWIAWRAAVRGRPALALFAE